MRKRAGRGQKTINKWKNGKAENGKRKMENRKLTTDWGTATAARTESRWPTENIWYVYIVQSI